MTNVTSTGDTLLAGELHVHSWPGSGQTVLGLSGLGSSGVIWDHLAATLPGAHVVGVDLRGRGRSSSLRGEPGLRAHALDLARVVRTLDLDDVIVVGHSMGAYLAVIAAQELGDRVARLVLVDGGLPPALPFFMTPSLTRLAFRAQLRKGAGPWADGEAFVRKLFGRELAERPDLVPVLARWLDYELDGPPGARRPRLDTDRVLADAVDTLHSREVIPALEALRTTAHVVAAQHKHGTRGAPFLSDAVLTAAGHRFPQITSERVPDTNHVTVLFAPQVREAVRGA